MTEPATSPLPPNYNLQSGYPDLTQFGTSAPPLLIHENARAGCRSPYWKLVQVLYHAYFPRHRLRDTRVAMGRIIGNGDWYFHIINMAGLPEHQRKSLGDIVLKRLLRYIKEIASVGEPFINLLADPPGRKLYRKNMFIESAPVSTGMLFG
ncbi:hypothetical protein BDW66DRAFT_163821 [Aspergillus desertorum]